MPKIAREMSAIEISKLSGDGRYMVGGVVGLHLRIAGVSKSWILRATYDGKRTDFGLGGYPLITVDMARVAAIELHRRIYNGEAIQHRGA